MFWKQASSSRFVQAESLWSTSPNPPSLASLSSDDDSLSTRDSLDDSFSNTITKSSSPHPYKKEDNIYTHPTFETNNYSGCPVKTLNPYQQCFFISEEKVETNQTKNTKKPQSFRDDPDKKAKVKTELCKYFIQGNLCPLGYKCNFAHGKHELRSKKLMDLKVDFATYRTQSCFDWVATGSW